MFIKNYIYQNKWYNDFYTDTLVGKQSKMLLNGNHTTLWEMLITFLDFRTFFSIDLSLLNKMSDV